MVQAGQQGTNNQNQTAQSCEGLYEKKYIKMNVNT